MKTLLVKAKHDEQPDSVWIHRFRNLGEDAWKALKDESDISIDEIDRSQTSFEVRGLKAKQVSRAKKTLRALVDAHGFDADLEIEEKVIRHEARDG